MNELGRRIEIGQTLSAAIETLGRQPLKFGGITAASAVLLALADSYLGRAGTSAGNIAIFVVSVVATLLGLQQRCGPDVVMKPNMGRALGASILSGIAILIGLILLIVPGAMLFARWALILPVIIREDVGVQAAMGRSADLTKGSRWHMIGLALIVWVPTIFVALLLSIVVGGFAGEQALDTMLFNLPLNVLMAGATIFGAVLFAEAYLTVSGEREGAGVLADIFA